MSIILLIRGTDEVRTAIPSANRFLVSQRHVSELRQGGEVLGIWLRRELDEGLATWCVGDDPLQVDSESEARMAEEDRQPGLSEAALGVRWSFALSGVWSLCWLDGILLREAMNSAERRRTILDALLSPAFVLESSRRPGKFLPVFGQAETDDFIEATMRALKRDYPQLITESWFVHDPKRGIVSPRGIEV